MRSNGIDSCEMSYSRLSTRICSGSSGRNGRNTLATSMLNTLPKFELAVILMYLMMLPKVIRPSITPSSSTIRFFSSRMMSADSLAMSVAVSTEMPTSASCSAGASLMPSPRKPTVWPSRCSERTTRAFCSGDILANTVTRVTSASSAASSSSSMSRPCTEWVTSSPTSRQILRVTASLSPVITLTSTPWWFSARIAVAAESFGGSRNARQPTAIRSLSSATLYGRSCSGSRRIATTSTRRPSSLSRCVIALISRRRASVIGSITSPMRANAQVESISSTAPLQISRCSPLPSVTTTDMRRRWKSNGISSTTR